MTARGAGFPVLVALLVVSSCSDTPQPLAPDDPALAQAQAPAPVDRLVIAPDSVELVTWEEVVLEVTGLDENGDTIRNAKVDDWVVEDPGGAIDWKGKVRTFEVTALDTGAGRVLVIGQSDGAVDTAVVWVRPLEDRLTLIDSTVLYLDTDPVLLTAGTYVFEVREGSPPALEPGDLIAGAQYPTFLRKVDAVLESTPRTLSLATSVGELSELFRHGARARAKIPGIKVGPKGRDRVPPGRAKRDEGEQAVEWGDPADLVDAAALTDIFELPTSKLCLEGSSGAGSGGGCLGVTISGRVNTDFDLDVDMKVSLRDPEFDLRVGGEIDFLVNYVAELEAEGKVTLEKEFATPWVRVTILGIPGWLRASTVPGITASISGKATFTHGFDGTMWAMAGLRYDGGWQDARFDAGMPFRWHDPAYQVGADATLRMYLETRAELVWAGTKTTAKRGPYGQVTVHADLEHMDHWPPLPPPVHADARVGYAVGLETKIEILDVLTYSWEWGPHDLMSRDVFGWWGQGRLGVDVVTTGVDPDPSGYTLSMVRARPDSTPAWDNTLIRATAPGDLDARVVFERDPGDRACMFLFTDPDWQNCHMVNAWHLMDVADVMWNCEVVETNAGTLPRAVHIHPFTTVDEDVDVTCISVFEALSHTVDEMLADGRIANPGIARALQRQLANGDAARMRGSVQAAQGIMDGFINLVEAASDAHTDRKRVKIEHDAARLLIERARQVKAEYIG